MNDYEVEVTDDRGKIAALISVIVIVIILLVALVVITFIDMKNENANNPKQTTTTKRNLNISDVTDNYDYYDDNETTTASIEETTEATTDVPIQVVDPTTAATTKGTTKGTTASKKTSGTKTATVTQTRTTVVTTIIDYNPFANDPRTVLSEGAESGYPDSKSDWEWDIVRLINKDRKANGLPELKFVKELRALAEEGADLMLGSTPATVKAYLAPHNNYRFQSNYTIESPQNLYDRTKSLGLDSDNSLKYLGVGVLYKQGANLGAPTYYYVLIWE